MSGTTSAPRRALTATPRRRWPRSRAKTLILTGTKDLLNPEFEPIEAGKNIKDVKMMTISPGTVTGHAAAGGFFPADVEFLNRETSAFLDAVTAGGKTLN